MKYSETKGKPWPHVSLEITSFWLRAVLAFLLWGYARILSWQISLYNPYATEKWLVWWIFAILLFLIFAAEIFHSLSLIAKNAVGPIFRCTVRGLESILGQPKARKATIMLVRCLTFPVRAYYHPTIGGVTLSCVIHWFLFGAIIWFFESFYYDSITRTVSSAQVVPILWNLAVHLVSSELEATLPQTDLGRLFSFLALLIFLFMLAAYAVSFKEKRERLLQKTIRNKPRFLPMYGHILVTGDIPAIRSLLQQFELYGVRQDIVIATKCAATAAVVGLKNLESCVWAVEGNLWEEDVRRLADVRHARELIVLGCSMDRTEVLRTVLSVEADNPSIRSSVDAEKRDNELLSFALGDRDQLLRWEERRDKIRKDLSRIPHLASLLSQFAVAKNTNGTPFHLIVERYSANGDEDMNYRQAAPLLSCPAEETGTATRLGVKMTRITRDSIVEYTRWKSDWEKTRENYWKNNGYRIIEKHTNLWKKLEARREAEESPTFHSSLRELNGDLESKNAESRLTGEELRAVMEKSITKNSAMRPRDRERIEQNDDTDENRGRRRLVVADSHLMQEKIDEILCAIQDIDGSKSENGAYNAEPYQRFLFEFHEPDSASAFLAVCEKLAAKSGVAKHFDFEAYSDLELRSIFLSLCVLSDGLFLEFLDGMWPTGAAPRGQAKVQENGNLPNNDSTSAKIRFEKEFYLGHEPQSFLEISRQFAERGCLLAYRQTLMQMDDEELAKQWVACDFHSQIHPLDELLFVREVNQK